jgi:hypothetical protein
MKHSCVDSADNFRSRNTMTADPAPQSFLISGFAELDCCFDQPQGQMESGSWQATELCVNEVLHIPNTFENKAPYVEDELSVPPGPCSEDRSRPTYAIHKNAAEHVPSMRGPHDVDSICRLPSSLQGMSLSPKRTTINPHLSRLFRCDQEIVELILSALNPAQLHLLMRCSRAGRAAAESAAVWRCLLLRDYPPDATAVHQAFFSGTSDPKGDYRRCAAAAAVYVAGGCSPDLATVPEVHRFALGPRRLSPVPPLVEPRMFAAVARLGSRLYVLGGCTSLSSCLRRSALLVLPSCPYTVLFTNLLTSIIT